MFHIYFIFNSLLSDTEMSSSFPLQTPERRACNLSKGRQCGTCMPGSEGESVSAFEMQIFVQHAALQATVLKHWQDGGIRSSDCELPREALLVDGRRKDNFVSLGKLLQTYNLCNFHHTNGKQTASFIERIAERIAAVIRERTTETRQSGYCWHITRAG